MRFRFAVLAAVVAIEFVAAVVLVVKATSRDPVDIGEEELASARSAHQRRQSQRAPAPPQRQPDPEPRTRTRQPTPEPEPEPEPEPRRQPDQRDRSRPSLSANEDDSGSSDEVEVDDVRAPYDSGRYLDALELAEEYLDKDPDQAYIRRIAVSSACAVGEVETASKYYAQMNERDQKTSDARCKKYGIEDL